MSCKSAIYTVNSTPTVLTTGSIIPLGGIVRRYGQALNLYGNAINASAAGYYDVDVNVSLAATAAGTFTITLYYNGMPVPGATASETKGAAGDLGNLNLHALIRKGCACGDPAALTVVLTGGATINNIAVVVTKA